MPRPILRHRPGYVLLYPVAHRSHALGRRVQENLHTANPTGVYYTASWQAIEERNDATGATTTRYVWSPV
jgi:hypothetical protein